MDSVFGTICNDDEQGVLQEMEKLRSKFNERRSPEGAPAFGKNPEMTKLAGIFQARVEQELQEKEQERLINKTANEIFNETFESIIRENSTSEKKRFGLHSTVFKLIPLHDGLSYSDAQPQQTILSSIGVILQKK